MIIVDTKIKCFDDFFLFFPKHLVMVPKSATFVAPSDRNIYIYMELFFCKKVPNIKDNCKS